MKELMIEDVEQKQVYLTKDGNFMMILSKEFTDEGAIGKVPKYWKITYFDFTSKQTYLTSVPMMNFIECIRISDQQIIDRFISVLHNIRDDFRKSQLFLQYLDVQKFIEKI